MSQLLVIGGQTAAGKSALALALARHAPIEIVSADSVQIYRGLDIGSAKPSPEEQAQVTHHLIDIRDVSARYSAAEFVVDADAAIADAWSRGVTPVVVGGTGLYIRSLLRGLFEGPPANAEIRAELAEIAGRDGGPALHAMLADVDPETASRLHENDVLRITRALEVHRLTSEPLSTHLSRHRLKERRYDARLVCVTRERSALHKRINQRCVEMIERGLEAETHALVEAGASWDAPGFATLGYRHVADVARGRLRKAEMLQTFQTDTRRFAKRQGTFFRGQLDGEWLAVDALGFDADRWSRDALATLRAPA